ncbi:Alpha/Beta hydrolase protein [Xylaria bambusicola]|uniref:Alpha/Beta hydrolase protein n=1 Tax=Xylaria bambusicola TaxID=326684 RepID=UPI002008042A|nr:Alpha/Beta hydrolase protein [Xylaria bambusicola]KAI0513015.1 Alpha/Beta hydrolase protein [Xylaria bambusicola]
MAKALDNDQTPSILKDSTHKLLLPDDISTGNGDKFGTPLIICFHGSGETCSPSWDNLAAKLVAETHCRVLLYSRGPGNLKPADVAAQMWDYVLCATRTVGTHGKNARQSSDLQGPYLLIAHSYGGAFARAFIQHEYRHRRQRKYGGDRVLGLVLVETGQEGGLDAALDEEQIRRKIMGDRPVCVIRGNSLLGKWEGLEAKEKAAQMSHGEEGEGEGDTRRMLAETERRMVAAEREMLLRMDAEDERLKRRQLGLSRTNRFVHLPDCGHHVVLQRPGDVVDAVRWVLENAECVHEGEVMTNVWKGVWKRVRRFRLW